MPRKTCKSCLPSKLSRTPSHAPSRPSPLRSHSLLDIQQHVSKLAGAQLRGKPPATTISFRRRGKGLLELTSLGSVVGTASSLLALDVEAWRIGISMLPANPTFSDIVPNLGIWSISFREREVGNEAT